MLSFKSNCYRSFFPRHLIYQQNTKLRQSLVFLDHSRQFSDTLYQSYKSYKIHRSILNYKLIKELNSKTKYCLAMIVELKKMTEASE